jgi:hypothetical protein
MEWTDPVGIELGRHRQDAARAEHVQALPHDAMRRHWDSV